MQSRVQFERCMFPEPQLLTVGAVRLATHIQGDGEPVVLLHGFPELGYSWRHQMAALADAGFQAIAPDQRGYGASDCPPAVEDYSIQHLMADIDGLLDALGLSSARFVAHDWGAIVLWQYALTRPERIRSMAILNIPFYPRPPVDPIQIFRTRFGDDFYIVNFQDSDEADRAFNANPRRLIQHLVRKNQLQREQFDALPAEHRVLSLLRAFHQETPSGEALLTNEELDFYVEQFEKSSFTGGINWYRNMTRNWASSAEVEQRVRVPTLFIGARDDVVIPLADIESMRDDVDDLHIEMLAPCGHWSQQERPADVNRLLLDFFARH